MEIRPRLKYLGSFGLQESIKHAEVVIPMSLRRCVIVNVDDPRGVRSWRLTFKALPGTLDSPVEDENGQLVSREQYIWDFFNARKGGSVKSFIIKSLRDGKDYLAVFRDKELTLEMFATKLYSTGLMLDQIDEPDVQTLEDGSLGQSENPDRI